MKIFITLIYLIVTVYCKKKGKRIEINETPKLESIDFKNEQLTEQFLLSMQSFDAFNLQKKYEIGRLVTMIINSRKQRFGPVVKLTKRDEENLAAVEPDLIDKNPEASWRTADSYMKAYKQKRWIAIKDSLRREPVYVRSKVAVRAINDEEVDLLKAMLNQKYTYIPIERYNYALKLYKEKSTTKLEEIIDFIEKNYPELGTAVNMKDKLKLGLAYSKVHDYIYQNNYPMLRRALDEGFNPNFVFNNNGSLLGLSVMARCVKCVKILIERGADVNYPILTENVVEAKGWGRLVIPTGWTPLMMAVADGQVRMVKELIESGSALVSKTAKGQESERFHARETARRIDDEELKKEIFSILKPSDNEARELSLKIEGKNFVQAIQTNDYKLVDNFLLLRPNLNGVLDQIPYIGNISEEMVDVLHSESIIRLK